MYSKRHAAFLLVAAIAVAVALPRRNAPPPLAEDGIQRVVILGDSVARGAGDETGRGIAGALDTLLPSPHEVINLGIDGARTRTVLARIDRFEALRRADAIVLSIGGNDLFGDSHARLFSMLAPRIAMRRGIARVETLVARIRRENAHATIILLGLYNPYRRASIGAWVDKRVAEWDARLIAAFADDSRVDVVRIADLLRAPQAISALDRFHPSGRGYRAIAERIAYGTRSSG